MKRIQWQYSLGGDDVEVTIEYSKEYGEPLATVTSEDIVNDAQQGRSTFVRFAQAMVCFQKGTPSLENTHVWGEGEFRIITIINPA